MLPISCAHTCMPHLHLAFTCSRLYASAAVALLSVTFKLIEHHVACSGAAVKSVFEAAFSKIEADQSFRQSDHAEALELVTVF